MEKYNRPENCNNLNNPKVNEEIWEDAFPYMRRNDCAMRKVISYLTTGMIPLIQVIDSCVTAAKNGDKVDIKSTISSGNDALRLLAAAYVKMNSIRKQSFRPVLKVNFCLCITVAYHTVLLTQQGRLCLQLLPVLMAKL